MPEQRVSPAEYRPDLQRTFVQSPRKAGMKPPSEAPAAPKRPSSGFKRSLWDNLKTVECHGMSNLASSDKFRLQATWAVVMTTACVVMGFFLYQNTLEYLRNPIVTSFDFVSDQALPFPDLYLCPNNYINSTYMRKYSIDAEWAKYFLKASNGSAEENILGRRSLVWTSLLPGRERKEPSANENGGDMAGFGMGSGSDRDAFGPGWALGPDPRRHDLTDYLRRNVSLMLDNGTRVWQEVLVFAEPPPPPTTTAPPSTTSESTTSTTSTTTTTTTPAPPPPPTDLVDYFIKVGYTREAFVKECSFAGEALDCGSAVEEVFDKDRGKCFLLRDLPVQQKEGLGISLVLHLNVDEYPAEDSGLRRPVGDGVTLFLSHKHSPAVARKILVPPAQLTQVSLEASRIRRISGYNKGVRQECRRPDEVDGLSVLRLDRYEEAACRMDCVQALVVAECGCVLAVDPRWLRPHLHSQVSASPAYWKRNSTSTYCLPSELRDCVGAARERESAGLAACSRRCAPACEEWTYAASLSAHRFPNTAARQDDPALADEMQRNLVILDVAFGALGYVMVEQSESMTPATFVSNIGGVMGVWMGASILTLLQLLILLLSACCCPSPADKV